MQTISYSSMHTFEECPLKYKLTYIDKIKTKGKSNIYGAFGSAVHLCIQRFYNNGQFNRNNLISIWAKCFYEEIEKPYVEQASVKEKSRLLGQGYPILNKFFSYQFEQGLLKKPIATELEFSIPCKNKNSGKVLLIGKIDIIFETNDGFEIIDFKTTASKYQWADNRITSQLVLYYLAFTLLKKDYKTAKCKICLHFLRPGIKNYFTITKHDKIKALIDINNHLSNIKTSDFKPNHTKESCKYCQYTEICPAFKIDDKIIKGKLFPYQKSDVAFMLKNKRVLNANEMGLGKTIETIYVGESLHEKGEVNNILVITPSNMKYQWDEKINEFAKKPSVEIISGNRANRRKLYDNNELWTIASYDSIGRDKGYINRVWDMIVLDDPSVFKNYKTEVRKSIDKLSINRETNYKYILTATPIENNLAEMYSIARYLDFRIFGNFKSFDRKYVERNYFNGITGYKNIFDFISRINSVLVRNKVDDVKKDMPSITLKYDYIDFLPEQAKLYDAVVESTTEFLEDKINKEKLDRVIDSESLSKFTYLRELCDSTQLIGKEKHSAKTNRLKELLDKILPNKVIVFSEFASMLRILDKSLKQKTIIVSGKDNSEEKHKKVEMFKNSKDINILLCTDVLKYGQDLQCAHYLINFDMPWKYTTLEQRWGRERRIGQIAKKVVVINLIMKNSCEDRMIEILGYKKKLGNIIDDNKYDRIAIPASSGITYKNLKGIIVKRKNNEL